MTATSARRPLFRWAALAAVAAAGLGTWYAMSGRNSHDGPGPEPPPPDPRLAFDTPFRNVRPDVKYVGDAACAACHAEIDKTYHAHPMGRSAAVGAGNPVERFDAGAHNPFTVGPYELRVERAGGVVRHHVRAKDPAGNPLPEYVTTADLSIGSGTRGRSYVCLQDGEAWQSPISWFGPAARWDLSPGFDLGNGGRRGVVAECLFCHVDRVDPLPGTLNRYRAPVPVGQPAIGCERCHGPGELHVAQQPGATNVTGIDTSIVNPRHLSGGLRAGICAQCHLQAEQRVVRRGRELSEYRPGLPLEQFVTLFVRNPDLADMRKSVGQFEQMHVSRCFTASGGRLGCTSCHDPHAAPAPADRDRFYRGRCLTCHGPGGRDCSEQASARQTAGDNCVACHMPRAGSSNIVHTSVTDHRVPRRPAAEDRPRRALPPNAVPLRPFPVGADGPPAAELERDLGIALARSLARVPEGEPGSRATLAALAEERLAPATASRADDLAAWLELAKLRGERGDREGALAAATAAARLAPASEPAQLQLARAAAALGRLDVAVAAATELIRISPTGVDPLLLRAGLLMNRGDWAGVERDCRAALAIHPLHPQGWLLLAVARHHAGDPAGGRRAADTAAGLAVTLEERAATLEWYRNLTR